VEVGKQGLVAVWVSPSGVVSGEELGFRGLVAGIGCSEVYF